MLRTKQGIAWAVLALSLLLDGPAQAENWVAVGPGDSALYYDTQTVRTTSDRLIAVWLSNGPARTQTGADGRTDYAILTLVDCKDRKAGSKLSLDGGLPLKGYALNSSMGAHCEALRLAIAAPLKSAGQQVTAVKSSLKRHRNVVTFIHSDDAGTSINAAARSIAKDVGHQLVRVQPHIPPRLERGKKIASRWG